MNTQQFYDGGKGPSFIAPTGGLLIDDPVGDTMGHCIDDHALERDD